MAIPKYEANSFSSNTSRDEVNLITIQLKLKGDMPLTAVIDSGASNNFVRWKALRNINPKCVVERVVHQDALEVRLATGAIVKVKHEVVKLRYKLNHREFVDEFTAMELDDKYDVILGLPWLMNHKPTID